MVRTAIFFYIMAVQCVRVVHAEGGCPPGQYPQQGQGWQTCVPIPGVTNGASRPVQPEMPPIQWLDRWQAIVTDSPKGVLGTSTDQPTDDAARAVAMNSCRSQSGGECHLQGSYRNGCAVMIVGDKKLFTRGGENLEDLKKSSLAECNTDDSNCRVYYSHCSLPVEAPL